MLNQIVVEMQNQLVEAKKQVAVSIADEKRLQEATGTSRSSCRREWERKAMLAVRGGRRRAGQGGPAPQGRARQAAVVSSSKQWGLQKQAVEKLKDQLRTLNDKIEEAKRKKNILIARQKRAEAQRAIQDTMRGLSDTSAFDTFDRMSPAGGPDRRPSPRPRSSWAASSTGDTLQQKFKAARDVGGGGADHALAELKAKMGRPMPGAKIARRAAAEACRRARAGQSEEAARAAPPTSPEPHRPASLCLAWASSLLVSDDQIVPAGDRASGRDRPRLWWGCKANVVRTGCAQGADAAQHRKPRRGHRRLSLQGMDGFAFCRQLRKMASGKGCPSGDVRVLQGPLD
mgnify:CR=1 FL=1